MLSLKLAPSVLRKSMKVFFCGVECVMRSQVMDRYASRWGAVLELARLMSGELLQESVTLALAFSLSTS